MTAPTLSPEATCDVSIADTPCGWEQLIAGNNQAQEPRASSSLGSPRHRSSGQVRALRGIVVQGGGNPDTLDWKGYGAVLNTQGEIVPVVPGGTTPPEELARLRRASAFGALVRLALDELAAMIALNVES